MHNNGVCEPDKDGDGAVTRHISDQGQASLCAVLQAVQDILLPKQYNGRLLLEPDIDSWSRIRTAMGPSNGIFPTMDVSRYLASYTKQ